MKNVLIVEDESLVALEIAETVSSYGFVVADICGSGEKALELADALRPDIVLMDIHIKGAENGIRVAQQIQQQYQSAVIFLTAYSDTPTIREAMEIEPLGYLIKPIFPNELFAMLTLAANRGSRVPAGTIIMDAEFSYDTAASRLLRNGEPIRLTKRERQLLEMLIRSQNGIVSVYDMENGIWPEKTPNENTRRSLVSRLRAKLDNRFIDTLPGEGYRIVF